MLNQQRTHIIIPTELMAEIDIVIGKRGRSKFLVEAARKELDRLRLEQVLDKVIGIWKDKDHPELKQGSAHWVAQLRKTEASRSISNQKIMAQYLLDTSVIIDVLNNKHDRASLLRNLLSEGHTFSCCSINIAEVYSGMRPKEKALTEALLNSIHCYDITKNLAAQAGILRYEWSQRGLTLSTSDTIIAAVALAHKLVLMTDNLKHYPMPELKKFSN